MSVEEFWPANKSPLPVAQILPPGTEFTNEIGRNDWAVVGETGSHVRGYYQKIRFPDGSDGLLWASTVALERGTIPPDGAPSPNQPVNPFVVLVQSAREMLGCWTDWSASATSS